MRVGRFDTGEKILIVAEIGNNHEGSFELAKKLVRLAAENGADAVKFQTFKTRLYMSRSDPARFKRLKSFELKPPQFAVLSRLARSLGLLFLSTPLDLESAEVLEPIIDAFKVASGDNDFYPLLERLAKSRKPVIVSTGASDLAQVDKTASFLKSRWPARKPLDLGLLHCVSSYPLPPEQANLRAIPFMASRFPELTVGYSDHAAGIEASVLAAALGARVIEKHFTCDKNHSGFRDHSLSADPADMRELVRRVRQACAMLGRPEKALLPCEEALAKPIRRSAAAAADLPKGHRLRSEDLLWLRPGLGLRAEEEPRLVGKTLRRALRRGEFLAAPDLSGPRR